MIYAFMIITFIFLVVVEIFTVLFRLTGMSEKRARFQVISMLTGTGFTTKESESILTSVTRRRLALVIILFGYTSSVTIISLFVNLYTHKISLKDTISIGAYCLLVLLITRIKFIKVVFDGLIERIANHYLNRKIKNKLHTLSNYNENILVELTILNHVNILDTPLSALNLKSDNIQILNIERHGKNISNPTGLDVIHIDDKLLVFGNEKNIRESFNIY